MNTHNKTYITKIQKLACGHSTVIPGYATVRAYKTKSGKRMFAISHITSKHEIPASGNVSLQTVIEDIKYLF